MAQTQDEDGFPIGAKVSGAERKAAREAALAAPVDVIDLTPTPTAYRRMLEVIARDAAAQTEREWAAAELERIKDVTQWGVAQTADEQAQLADERTAAGSRPVDKMYGMHSKSAYDFGAG